MKDKISVIMPAYNVEKYIGKSIESVLRQTYDNFELVVVNDGSIDGTEAVVAQYQSQDDRVGYIYQQNQGVSIARNTGIEHAKGKYIAFLDADDLYHENALEILYNHLKNIDCETGRFVYGRTKECVIDTNGKHDGKIISGDGVVYGMLDKFVYQDMDFRVPFHISACLVEKNILLDNDIFFIPNVKIGEDTAFFMQIAAVTKLHAVNEVVSYYVYRDSSASHEHRAPAEWVWENIFPHITSWINEHNPSFADLIKNIRLYVTYRHILSCIRLKYFNEARDFANLHRKDLELFSLNGKKINDRYKCKLILQCIKSDRCLSILGKL